MTTPIKIKPPLPFRPGWYIYSGDQVKYFEVQARMPMIGPFATELDALATLLPSAQVLREEYEQKKSEGTAEQAAAQLREVLEAIAEARKREDREAMFQGALFPTVKQALLQRLYEVKENTKNRGETPITFWTSISW